MELERAEPIRAVPGMDGEIKRREHPANRVHA